MCKQYDDIVIDEVMYWFDVLQDNSLRNIANTMGIERDKVRKVLDAHFESLVPRYGQTEEEVEFILKAS